MSISRYEKEHVYLCLYYEVEQLIIVIYNVQLCLNLSEVNA